MILNRVGALLLLLVSTACAGASPEVQARRAAEFAAASGAVRQSVDAAGQCSPNDQNSLSGSYAVGNVVQEGVGSTVGLSSQHTCQSLRGNLRPQYHHFIPYGYGYSYNRRYWW